MQIQYILLRAHLCTAVVVDYSQKPVFEIIHEKSVKVCLHNGNVQQNSLCLEPCVTEELPISPWFSPTIFIAMQIQYSYEHTFVQQ